MATKKSRSKLIIVFLLIAVVLISGCAGKKATPAQAAAGGGKIFVGGDKGLVASFLSGAPPKDTYKGEAFDISVNLENKGEAEIAAGAAKVYLGGVSLDSFGMGSGKSGCAAVPWAAANIKTECQKITSASACASANLDAVAGGGECVWTSDASQRSNKEVITAANLVGSQVVPGGQEEIAYAAKGYQYDVPGAGLNDLTLTATVCYPYKTTAIALACLSPNLLAETVGKEVCKVSGEKNPQSSGAPVKVTSVVELPLGKHKAGFQVKIKDVGNGNAFQKPVDGCRDMKQSDLGKIAVSAALGTTSLSCSPPTVTLAENKEATTTCKPAGDLAIEGVSQQVLTVTLGYNYLTQTSQKFNVKPSS